MLVIVQVKNVSVEELALLGGSSIGRGVVNGVLSLSITGGTAQSRIEWTIEDLASDESVVALSIKRCVNGISTIVNGIRVTGNSSDGVVSVTVRSSNQDLELIAVLSVLGQKTRFHPDFMILTRSCWRSLWKLVRPRRRT